MGFPILKGKHDWDSMINPDEFVKYRRKNGDNTNEKPPESVIICYSRKLMEYILKHHKNRQVKRAFYDRLYLVKQGKKEIGVIGGFGVGSPVASIVLEELIAFGVKKFISIGTAGTLQKHIKIGELMVCDRAIRDEGTSHHYVKTSKYAYPSKEMTGKIKKVLEKMGQKYFIGTSWTIDAPYRETVAEAKHYQKEGVATVEMEASALFTIAQYRKVKLGAIFTISDSLAELAWKPMFHSKKAEVGLETLYKIAVEALKD